MPELDHWLKWKEKCALALCPPMIQSALQDFVHTRFRRYAAQYAASFNVGGTEVPSTDARDAWHWFETHFRLHANRQGKSYKEWLFARAAVRSTPAKSDGIDSGVSLLLRDVVRDHLRREYSPKHILSLDASVCSKDSVNALSPMDLLPDSFDTTSDVERRETELIAARLADSVFDHLSRRQRIALLGRELGVSLANPCVLKVAGCGKSVLAKAHRSALAAVAGQVSAAYPDEPRAAQAVLTVSVFNIVSKRTISWASTENSLSEFLNIVEVMTQHENPT